MDLSQDREILQEFLVETAQNLGQLDLDLVALEQRPDDPGLLNSIFRTIHTVKGTCGFLGLQTMERISHVAENVLNRLRNGDLKLSPALVTLILDTVDALKRESASLEATSAESGEAWDSLIERLKQAEQAPPGAFRPSGTTGACPVPETMPALDATQHAAGQEAVRAPEARAGETTIRIDVDLADRLVNLVGELVLVRNQMLEASESRDKAVAAQMRHRLNLITSELQENVMKTRMQPVGSVWNKLPRIVRDLGTQLGKQIKLVMEGAETEMDRSIIEAIRDPLTHIVRNSCDHGIEKPQARRQRGKPGHGTLRLRAYHESGQVVIEISDDGGGIDIEKVCRKAVEQGLITAQQLAAMDERQTQELILLPGFSTADQVSSISGRGVGMDVVKSNIQRIGGTFELHSHFGHGTTLRIRIPLTLAIIPGLLVSCGSERFVIPQASLLDLLRVQGEEVARAVRWVDDNPVFRRDGALWPLLFVSSVLGMAAPVQRRSELGETLTVVFVHAGGRRFGLVVDAIHSTREIVVKPLGRMARRLGVYAGATILDDGSVALIVDVAGLGRRTRTLEGVQPANSQADSRSQDAGPRDTLLLVEAGAFGNLAIPLDQVGRLEKFRRDSLELAAGEMVTQYRGSILPLVRVSEVLSGVKEPWPASELPTVVVQRGDRRAGLIVDRIRDIRSAKLEARQGSHRCGILCSAIFDGRVCDVVDLDALVPAGSQPAGLKEAIEQ
jgi:two-component system chemotaxis sensor kinase CheA